jgi:2C-methyl-D-erythritol 2,4-cyclodiphosphate synthase
MKLSDAATRTHARNLAKKGFLRKFRHVGEANKFDLTPLFMALEARKAKEEADLQEMITGIRTGRAIELDEVGVQTTKAENEGVTSSTASSGSPIV